ncbi:hypothetical protein Ctob_001314 [Chrysochromulina tobinii]|uniref:Uncharacterized protein n=1 Tax=Chrysochromulina tobinii TaxID=1460289 RepID=A0A0M0J691_9EUKA|nr:hypothetical protein Ctob_001314 [Chrysochromulina tobinii]|eukprot:KOO21748.1 hypothetical protein Ctob_001314 [Chrysochromulina sp. CCMP291]
MMKKELEEITARIEATLTHYEMMEENGADRWSGMRRDDQVDATLAQLAEHGRERVDVVLIALREVATERQMVLNELRAQLEAARSADDTGRGRADSDESEDASAMEEARLFEKLDRLEAIQRRIQTAGERLLEYQRKSQSQALLTSLQEEVANQKGRLEKLMAEATERAAQLEAKTSALEASEYEVGRLTLDLREVKERAAKAGKEKESEKLEKEKAEREALEAAQKERDVLQKLCNKLKAERDELKGQLDSISISISEATSPSPPRPVSCDHAFSYEWALESSEGFGRHVEELRELGRSLGAQLREHAALTIESEESLTTALASGFDAAARAHTAIVAAVEAERDELKAQLATRPASAPRAGDDPPPSTPHSSRPGSAGAQPPNFRASKMARAVSLLKADSMRASARGSAGLESELQRTQYALISAKQELQQELTKLDEARASLLEARQQLAELSAMADEQRAAAAADLEAAQAAIKQAIADAAAARKQASANEQGDAHTAEDAAAAAAAVAQARLEAERLEQALTHAEAQAREARRQAEAERAAKLAALDGRMEATLVPQPEGALSTALDPEAASALALLHKARSGQFTDKLQQAQRIKRLEEAHAAALAELKEESNELERSAQAEWWVAAICKRALSAELKSCEALVLTTALAQQGGGAAAAAAEAAKSRAEAAEAESVTAKQAADEAWKAARLLEGELEAANARWGKLQEQLKAQALEKAQLAKQLDEAGELQKALEAQRDDLTRTRDEQKAVLRKLEEEKERAGGEQLVNARAELERLRKASSAERKASAEQLAQLNVQHALELSEAQKASAAALANADERIERAVAARMRMLDDQMAAEAAVHEALTRELAAADTARHVAEDALEDARQAAAEERLALQEAMLSLDAAHEAKLMSATHALQVSSEVPLADAKRAARKAATRIGALEAELEQLKTALMTSLLPPTANATFLTESDPPIVIDPPVASAPPMGGSPIVGSVGGLGRSLDGFASTVEDDGWGDVPPPPQGSYASGQGSNTASGVYDGRDERPRWRPSGQLPLEMPAAVALLERTQRQLLEVSDLMVYERGVLLGSAVAGVAAAAANAAAKADALEQLSSVSAVGATAAGAAPPAPPGSRGGFASLSVASAVGAGARVAWLLREGIGHTDAFGIRGAVRPATKPLDTAQLQRVLRALFAQQRALSSQAALGNWELLGAMALLRPRQKRLQALHASLLAELRGEGGGEAAGTGNPDAALAPASARIALTDRRRAELDAQLPRIAALASQREQQREWCAQVWVLRRQAVRAVGARVMSQAVYALTKLTDAANVQPVGAGLLSRPGSAARASSARAAASPRLKKRDALAAAIFADPPVLPFVLPADGGEFGSLAHGLESLGAKDGFATRTHSVVVQGTQSEALRRNSPSRNGGGTDDEALAGLFGGAAEVWGKGEGLKTEVMQRICVAAQHWPTDFGRLGARLQRQLSTDENKYDVF